MKPIEILSLAVLGYVGYQRYSTGMWPWSNVWTDNYGRAWTMVQTPTGTWAATVAPGSPPVANAYGAVSAASLPALQAVLNATAAFAPPLGA